MKHEYSVTFRITPHITGEIQRPLTEGEEFHGVSIPDWVYQIYENRPRPLVYSTDEPIDFEDFEERLVHIQRMANRLISTTGRLGITKKRTRMGNSTNPNGGPPWRIDSKGGHVGLLVPVTTSGDLVDEVIYDVGIKAKYFIEIEFAEI